MAQKNQSKRLTTQHKQTHGVVGIFGDEAKQHDIAIGEISHKVMEILTSEFPQLTFRYRDNITKREINEALQKIDSELGQTLFVSNSSIIPDGGIIEVLDDNGNWRIILVSEAKHQGKDIENIKNGILVGKHNDQDIMAAGNAIERSHKNISEIANFMLSESHFPYVLFLEGSNFLTETIVVTRPDGREVTLEYHSGMLNRLDRLTAANYGMPINTNLCENKFVAHRDKHIMLQATSIYTQGNFTDLCYGTHVPATSYIKNFKLLNIAGAYWRGDVKNKQLTRIYGIAFFNQQDLDDYLNLLEERKKRDHRRLGKELGLFMMSEYGPGFPFWLPNGMTLRRELENYWYDFHEKNGYVFCKTPTMLSKELWLTSGHWANYKDNRYLSIVDEKEFEKYDDWHSLRGFVRRTFFNDIKRANGEDVEE